MTTQDRPSRREFLYCTLCASASLTAVSACAGVTWLAQPRPVPNQDVFEISLSNIPHSSYSSPTRFGNYFLVRMPEGLIALETICPHLGSQVKWSDENHRFECVSHGGQYNLDGSYITGPALRGLDRRVLHVTTPDGTVSTPEDGSPVSIEGATRIVLDVREEIQGLPRLESQVRRTKL